MNQWWLIVNCTLVNNIQFNFDKNSNFTWNSHGKHFLQNGNKFVQPQYVKSSLRSYKPTGKPPILYQVTTFCTILAKSWPNHLEVIVKIKSYIHHHCQIWKESVQNCISYRGRYTGQGQGEKSLDMPYCFMLVIIEIYRTMAIHIYTKCCLIQYKHSHHKGQMVMRMSYF